MLKKFFLQHQTAVILVFIICLGLGLRFLFFTQSTYFGFDEARDAFISQSIYLARDFKIIGPPANFPGLYHGPLYWYLVGPLYLLAQGNPLVVSAIFRVVNAVFVLLVFAIGNKLFNKRVGLIAALLYALSFEQTQYAMYVGNPSFAVYAWMGIFYGASLLWKDKNPYGLAIMFVSAAVAAQLELIFLYSFASILVILFLLRARIKIIKFPHWLLAISGTILVLFTFLLAELKFGFQSAKAFVSLFQGGYSVMSAGDNRVTLYLKMFAKLFSYNILGLPTPYIYLLALGVVVCLFWFARRNVPVRLILVWLLSGLFILPFGGYDALYVNTGLGVAVLLAFGFLLEKVWNYRKSVFFLLLTPVLLSNLYLINKYNPQGLIVDIKAQQFMTLKQEREIINKIYETAQGRGFTVRVTSMPYQIQTVWAYLFKQYGEKQYGYLPFWETELVAGYPGTLPRPAKGTTCLRFLIREPIRGIPQGLIDQDIREENIFSKVVGEEPIGAFLLQIRKAIGSCHNERPVID